MRAAQEGRERLADAMAVLHAQDPASRRIESLEHDASRVVQKLFAAEAAEPEAVIEALGNALERLRALLVQLHQAPPGDETERALTQTVAETLAVLYPAHRELERALRPTEVEPIPLTRRRGREPEEDRRTTPRVSLEADIGFESESNFYTGFSGDVSDGGLFLATYDVLPIGTRLSVSFVLPEGHQVMTRGEVTWVRAADGIDSDLHPGMGIAFEALSKRDQEAIRRFISRRPPLFFEP